MKEVNDYKLPLANDFLIKKPIKKVMPGDILLIGNISQDSLEDHYIKYLKLVVIPKQEVTVTKGGNILAEGFDSYRIGIQWLPRFTFKYFWGLINFDSFDIDGYIVCCFKNPQINHLFESHNGDVVVLTNVEKFVSYFNIKF